MSNYDKHGFPGRESQVIAGPEVVNGTGQVWLEFHDLGDEETVMFLMDADEVLKLAEWLAGHAFGAEQQKWREHHTLSGFHAS